MKKILALLLAALFLTGYASCAQDEIKVMLNGEYLSFAHPPVIIEGRVMVPLREIFERFGANLTYDADVKVIKATLGKKVVKMSPGVKQAVYEFWGYKKNMTLDVPPTNIDGVTYIPLRFAAEAFDMKADWDAPRRTAVIINLEIFWKKLKDGAPILYNGFFDPPPLPDKSTLTGSMKVSYTVQKPDGIAPDSLSFDVETQGYSDGKAEKKDSYVTIDAKGPTFDGVPIPAKVNFSTILRNSQYYIRTDLWSSMNNLSIVKKYDDMWIKAGAEGSETIPFYVMFGLNLKKFVDAYIKDAAFSADINTYNYLNGVVDGLINLEKQNITNRKQDKYKITELDYKDNGQTANGRDVQVELYANKTAIEGEHIDRTFRLKLSVPGSINFTYENSLKSVASSNVPDVEVVPNDKIARYDDIQDALRLAEIIFKIKK